MRINESTIGKAILNELTQTKDGLEFINLVCDGVRYECDTDSVTIKIPKTLTRRKFACFKISLSELKQFGQYKVEHFTFTHDFGAKTDAHYLVDGVSGDTLKGIFEKQIGISLSYKRYLMKKAAKEVNSAISLATYKITGRQTYY